jgi:hypothetical protein
MLKTSINNFILIKFYKIEIKEGRYILVFGSRIVSLKDLNIVLISLFVL